MKKKHAQVLDKVILFYKAEARVSGRQLLKRQDLLKSKMLAAQIKLKTEKEK